MDRWVLLAGERGGRPSDLDGGDGETEGAVQRKSCPFCPGHEGKTPPETYAVRLDGSGANEPGWLVRVVPNKYPAVWDNGWDRVAAAGPEGALARRPGVGLHEVVIESPDHDRALGHHPAEHGRLVFEVLRDRCRALGEDRRVRLVTPFYNHGPGSGASLSHPHFQVVAQTVVSQRVARLVGRARDYAARHGDEVFDVWLGEELADSRRVVAISERFAVICPFASRGPYEMWVVGRENLGDFGELGEAEVGDLAEVVQGAVRRLDAVLHRPAYNIAWHMAPRESGGRGWRWFLQVLPRVQEWGGFELATEVYINTFAPEDAAADLRAAIW